MVFYLFGDYIMAVGLFGRQDGLKITIPDVVVIRFIDYNDESQRWRDLVRSIATVGVNEIIIVSDVNLNFECQKQCRDIEARPDLTIRSLYPSEYSNLKEMLDSHDEVVDIVEITVLPVLKQDQDVESFINLLELSMIHDVPSIMMDFNLLEVGYCEKPLTFAKKRYSDINPDLDIFVQSHLNDNGKSLLDGDDKYAEYYNVMMVNIATHKVVKPDDNREPYVMTSAFRLLRQVPFKIFKHMRIIPTWSKTEND